MGDLVIRDEQTGESRVFVASTEGYQQAANYRNEIESKGHTVGDDGDSLGRLSSIFPSPYH